MERFAKFIGYGFSMNEKREDVAKKIVELCSFQSLSKLEVHRTGEYSIFSFVVMENKKYFRKGELGDWKNCLNAKMKERLDQITTQKFRGSGLAFD